MEIDRQDLENYLKSLLEAITSSVGNRLTEPAEIEIAIVNKYEVGGKLKILIAGIDGAYAKEIVSRLKLKIL